MSKYQVIVGDCIESMRGLADQSVNCCVTSPPYFGLRDYGVDGQIGLEQTPEEYVTKMVEVFREVRRVLRDDGSLWLNLGDSYGKGKQMLGIPWKVAFALQDDGWYLRQDIIWSKPNPMPESVRDRCTKSHEYIFLLTKSKRYYYDHDAIREPHTGEAAKAVTMGYKEVGQRGVNSSVRRGLTDGQATQFSKKGHSGYFGADGNCLLNPLGKNKRSVWSVPTRSVKGAHFATFPPALIEPCILAGCPVDGIVLDPFAGSGTTAEVSAQNGRDSVMIELNPEYAMMIHHRMSKLK